LVVDQAEVSGAVLGYLDALFGAAGGAPGFDGFEAFDRAFG
jgi:hypothetical protein